MHRAGRGPLGAVAPRGERLVIKGDCGAGGWIAGGTDREEPSRCELLQAASNPGVYRKPALVNKGNLPASLRPRLPCSARKPAALSPLLSVRWTLPSLIKRL